MKIPVIHNIICGLDEMGIFFSGNRRSDFFDRGLCDSVSGVLCGMRLKGMGRKRRRKIDPMRNLRSIIMIIIVLILFLFTACTEDDSQSWDFILTDC